MDDGGIESSLIDRRENTSGEKPKSERRRDLFSLSRHSFTRLKKLVGRENKRVAQWEREGTDGERKGRGIKLNGEKRGRGKGRALFERLPSLVAGGGKKKV